MQRSDLLPPSELSVAEPRLLQQAAAILESHDGIYMWIQLSDVVEIGRHDLDTGELPRADRVGERASAHHNNL